MNDPRFDPLPPDTMKRLDRFARDLAWGFWNGKWDNEFLLRVPAWRELRFVSNQNPDLQQYLTTVWKDQLPNPVHLEEAGYIKNVRRMGDDIAVYALVEKGLQLARRALPGPVFISYRRVESTPFAMLLSDRMQAKGLVPFLDNQSDKEEQGVSLKPGRKWADDLKVAIEAREYFVVLVGPTTLSSDAVRQEIQLALDFHKQIIPIWHRRFDPKNKEHVPVDLPTSIREVIDGINAIPIIAEDPHQYEAAIERLFSILHIIP